MYIHQKIDEILKSETKERILCFTEEAEMRKLLESVNRLLEDRQELDARFERQQEASKKMLSNISHDIKTPLTVILGYLEMMQMKEKQENKKSQRINRYVCERI